METQEREIDEQRYIKGFNDGYLLTKHEPELAAKITAYPNKQNDYLQGFSGGRAEYEREVKEWAKGFSRNESSLDDKNLNKER